MREMDNISVILFNRLLLPYLHFFFLAPLNIFLIPLFSHQIHKLRIVRGTLPTDGPCSVLPQYTVLTKPKYFKFVKFCLA